MARKKIIAGNWKMFKTRDEALAFIYAVNNDMPSIDKVDTVICAPFVVLRCLVKRQGENLRIGAQNMHYSLDEKHTGEISTDQLKSLDILYSLIGHYERVREFNENKNIINEKLIAALDANIIPILCFGEDIDEDYKEVIPNLLNSYLKNIMNIDFIIFAYEPIYAIGTGTLPRIDKIKEVISFASKYLQDKYNKKPTIVYGGSVDSSNIKEILNIDNVDGVLIGNRSSNVKEVERMINNIE